MTPPLLRGPVRVAVALAVVLALWQAVHLAAIVPERYFPGIPAVLAAFGDMIASGDLLSGWALTFSRATIGLIAASLLGIGLAILSDLSPVFGRGFRYISDVLQPIPPAAFVPMAVFSLGLGTKLYAFVVILVTVWPPYLNGSAALEAVSPVQVATGRMLGCGRWTLLWRIKLPSAMPEIFAGIRYAATISLVAVVVSEMLSGSNGIGFMIYKKAFALRTADVFALMFVVGLNGVLMNGLVSLLRRGIVGWHQKMMERQE